MWPGWGRRAGSALCLWFPVLFTYGNLPQCDLQLLDFRWNVRGLEAAQLDGQMHQIQTKAHFIECLVIHIGEIG